MGVKAVGKATYIANHCNPQVFVQGNDVWIKHTDYMSEIWQPPAGEKIGMPMTYYAKKYFGISKSEKFIYADGWGSIVLRSEAWLKLENAVWVMKNQCSICTVRQIIDLQIRHTGGNWTIGSEMEWVRFWENVCNVVKGVM